MPPNVTLRKKLEEAAAEDGERFAKEMKEWEANGYYTLADGTRSDDAMIKPKREKIGVKKYVVDKK